MTRPVPCLDHAIFNAEQTTQGDRHEHAHDGPFTVWPGTGDWAEHIGCRPELHGYGHWPTHAGARAWHDGSIWPHDGLRHDGRLWSHDGLWHGNGHDARWPDYGWHGP